MRRKFGNKVTGKYHSKKESRRADDLRLLEKLGEISELREQVSFELIPKQDGERAVRYISDFAYTDKTGSFVVEDVKSPASKTPLYIVKRKLMKLVHNITIVEI